MLRGIPKEQAKNKLQLALIILLPFTAMGLAFIMYFTGSWIPDSRTNKGELILPPPQLTSLYLKSEEGDFKISETDGLWRVIVFGTTHCNQPQCIESLYKTRQVHIALGKDSNRVVRFFITPDKPELTSEILDNHPGVYWLSTTGMSVKKMLGINYWPENQIYIVDPLGNLIMKYQPDQPGKNLLGDLKTLLKASSVG